MTRWKMLAGMAAGVVVAGAAMIVPAGAGGRQHPGRGVDHIVVIYEENHSFDNLYGQWGAVNGEQVNGVPQAPLGHTVQVAQNGTPYTCLLQNDVNLTSPTPLSTQCTDPMPAVGPSHFINLPFNIDTYIPASAHDVSADERVRRPWRAERLPAFPAAAPRTSCTASTRSSTSSTTVPKTGM